MKKKILLMLICAVVTVVPMSSIPSIVKASTIDDSASENVNNNTTTTESSVSTNYTTTTATVLAEDSATESEVLAIDDIKKEIAPNIIVDKQYTGQNGSEIEGIAIYNNVAAAIASIDKNNSEQKIIYIKNGIYKEKLTISTPNITIVGESAERTIITYDDAAGTTKRTEDGGDGKSTYGTGGSASVRIKSSAKNFKAANITISNSFDESANSGMKNKQAVAMYDDADKSAFVNCKILGNQDTLCAYTNRQYYYNCLVEGDVDFIFGGAQAVFNNCEIRSINRDGITPKGYVSAPSTLKSKQYGYLMLNCKLTSNITDKGSVYLGRPWYAGADASKVICSTVYKHCYLGAHIATSGWTTMSNSGVVAYPKDNDMYEYNNYGPGATNIASENRKLLSDDQAANYTIENVLNAWDPSDDTNKLLSYKENEDDYATSEDYDNYIDKTTIVDMGDLSDDTESGSSTASGSTTGSSVTSDSTTGSSIINNNSTEKEAVTNDSSSSHHHHHNSSASSSSNTLSTESRENETNSNDLNSNTKVEVKNKWNKNLDGTWSFINSNGEKATGWIKDHNIWYYLNASGLMQKGWIRDRNGLWYYLSDSGAMKTGWFKDTNGLWYYLNNDGSMMTGWFKDVHGKWYYFNSSGDMAVNTTIDGYEINNTGVCIN